MSDQVDIRRRLVQKDRPGSLDLFNEQLEKFPFWAWTTNADTVAQRVLTLRDTWDLVIGNDLTVSNDLAVTSDLAVTGDAGVGRAPTGRFDVYEPSGALTALFESGTAAVTLRLKTPNTDFRLQALETGTLFRLRDESSSTNPVTVAKGSISNLLALSGSAITSAGSLEVTGVFRANSSITARSAKTVTTGTYSALDVTGINNILLNPSGGNITINDLSGGVAGQVIFVTRVNSANTVTLVDSSGSNQQLLTHTEANIASTTRFRDVWICDATASFWSVGGGP